MKKFEQVLAEYAGKVLTSAELIDQKTFHRKKVESLIKLAFLNGMDYMTRAHNQALAQLNDALDADVEDLTNSPNSDSIESAPEASGEEQEKETPV